MTTLFHIEASPRHEHSFSSRLATRFIGTYRETHPGDAVDHLHLFDHELVPFDEEATAQKMRHMRQLFLEGRGLERIGKWASVIEHIERLKAADKILLSSPMWNYSIPYRLKQYIDIIMQPGLTFGINAKGEYQGLLDNPPLQMILTSGSAYAGAAPDDDSKRDFQRPYLEHIAHRLGITDIRTIKAEPTAAAPPDAVEAMIEAKLVEAEAAARNF